MMAPDMTAREVIERLGLQPHPEGGHFRETFRDPDADASGRSVARRSTICWRRVRFRMAPVDAAEIWHYYAGAPMVITSARTAMMPAPIISGHRSKPPAATNRGAQGALAKRDVAGRLDLWWAAPWRRASPLTVSKWPRRLAACAAQSRGRHVSAALFGGLADVQACEERLINCWPAHQTVVAGDWLCRFAQGYPAGQFRHLHPPATALDSAMLRHIECLYNAARVAALDPGCRRCPAGGES